MKSASVLILCLLSFFFGCLFSVSFMSIETNVNKIPSHLRNKAINKYAGNKNVAIGSRDDLFIVIISAPSHFDRRKLLRETWINSVLHYNFSYVFCVGIFGLKQGLLKDLTKEQELYSDIVLLPTVKEHYDLLTFKVLEMFVWLNDNVHHKLVLKCDDDSFVNVNELNRSLTLMSKDQSLYWGYFTGSAPVHRRGKWKESQWNLCDQYTPYARGGGYIVSRDIVKYLAMNAYLFSTYRNEDVSVGLWLTALNITRQHDVNFDTEYKSRGCQNSYIVTHPHDEASMRKMHKLLLDTGRLCSKEETVRPAYTYDWTVLPSRCCQDFV